jgi:hypothetical protein
MENLLAMTHLATARCDGTGRIHRMTGLDLFWGLRVGDPADVVKLSHDGAAFVMHGIDYFPPRLSVFRVVYARRVEPLGALRVYVRRLSDDKACARLLGSLAIIVRVLFARIRVRIGTIPCQRGHDGSGLLQSE